MTDEQRDDSIMVDLDQLERHAESLYLHRFVAAVRRARGEHGRYLVLRAGDRLAMAAADDGSIEALEEAAVEPAALPPDAPVQRAGPASHAPGDPEADAR